jgi:vWA found in TerF C terminus
MNNSAAPAISLEKVAATAPGLVSLYKSAGVTLDKRGLRGERAAVYLVLDRSGSMRRFYRDGTVQHLAEQVLGLAAHFDDDGIVPVVFFSTEVDTHQIELGRHEGRINALHDSLGHMGRTYYEKAMRAVIDHHQSSGAGAPALVIFQTDGSPDNRSATTRLLTDASRLPLFWQFVGFGDDSFAYLHRLDTLSGRTLDNAGFFAAGDEPRAIPDAELYDRLMAEFPDWLREARRLGIAPKPA